MKEIFTLFTTDPSWYYVHTILQYVNEDQIKDSN